MQALVLVLSVPRAPLPLCSPLQGKIRPYSMQYGFLRLQGGQIHRPVCETVFRYVPLHEFVCDDWPCMISSSRSTMRANRPNDGASVVSSQRQLPQSSLRDTMRWLDSSNVTDWIG